MARALVGWRVWVGVRWGVGGEGGEAHASYGEVYAPYGKQSSVGWGEGGVLPWSGSAGVLHGSASTPVVPGMEGASLALSSLLSKGGAMSGTGKIRGTENIRETENFRGSRDKGAVVVSAPPPLSAVFSEEGGGGWHGNVGDDSRSRKELDESHRFRKDSDDPHRSRKEPDSRSVKEAHSRSRKESDDPHRVLAAAREEVGGRGADPLMHALMVSFVRRENQRCPPLVDFCITQL